jgi:hypothetical protein
VDSRVATRRGETEAHAGLKRLALVWAQANGYSACAAEVSLPRCRYRADVAAYRPISGGVGMTAIFECKQALPDLRRDSCCTAAALQRLATMQKRRAVLERCLRVHYPTLRSGESLFPEYDAYEFSAIRHRTYTRVTRELNALQNSLYSGTKFERLARYHCADLFYLVVPNELFRASELPASWGVLAQSAGDLALLQKPTLQPTSDDCRLRLLQRIAAAGTRQLNQKLAITFDEVAELRRKLS